MEDAVRLLFGRYERIAEQALSGRIDMEEVAALYAAEFIAASPAGVMTGKNDDQFREAMAQGYDRYRAIGTRAMRIRRLHLSPMDELHCVAHVAWKATYARNDQPDVEIDFDVHYLVQKLGRDAKVFGWVSGDEQAVLKAHGIL